MKPSEAKAGEQLIRSFMNLSVHDMKYTLDALTRVYHKALDQHDKIMRQELRILEANLEHAKKTRAKPAATHRSKKDRKLTWSGRGSMPTWMREEMKEMKLKADDFLIAKKR